MSVIIKNRTCRQCGAEFQGGPRAWYCPACREKRAAEALARHRQNKRAGKTIKIGETVRKCEVCGEPFIMMSARQRYCERCAPAAIKAADNARGREYMAAERADPERNEILKARKRVGMRKCVICGKEFVNPIGSKKRTCSEKCQHELDAIHQAKADYKRGRRKSLLMLHKFIKARNVIRMGKMIAGFEEVKFVSTSFRDDRPSVTITNYPGSSSNLKYVAFNLYASKILDSKYIKIGVSGDKIAIIGVGENDGGIKLSGEKSLKASQVDVVQYFVDFTDTKEGSRSVYPLAEEDGALVLDRTDIPKTLKKKIPYNNKPRKTK